MINSMSREEEEGEEASGCVFSLHVQNIIVGKMALGLDQRISAFSYSTPDRLLIGKNQFGF
jgi:hypothetical protein